MHDQPEDDYCPQVKSHLREKKRVKKTNWWPTHKNKSPVEYLWRNKSSNSDEGNLKCDESYKKMKIYACFSFHIHSPVNCAAQVYNGPRTNQILQHFLNSNLYSHALRPGDAIGTKLKSNDCSTRTR